MSKKNKSKAASLKKVLSNNIYAIKWLYKISPFYVLYTLIFRIIDGLSIMLEHTFLVAYIINCIENQKTFGDVLVFFIPVTGLIILRLTLYPIVTAYILPKHLENIDREMKMTLYKKAINMDISRYDDPDFYNDFVWAMQDAPGHIKGSLETLASFLKTISIVLVLGIYMITSDFVGLFFVFFTLFSVLTLRMALNKKNIAMEEEKKPYQRKRDYVNRVFYLSKYAKDLRLSEMGDKLYEDFQSASEEMEKTVKKHSKKIVLIDYLISAVRHILTFDGLYLTYLMYQTLAVNKFDYGTMVALYNASNALRRDMQNIAYMVPAFQQHSLYIDKMRSFLETENDILNNGTMLLPNNGKLELSDVSFRYPGSKENTLQNISMNISEGHKIALVGYNGAGKSTLIKLFMRLYDPTQGEILFGEKDIKSYPLNDYRKNYGVIFQDFELIAASLAENVTMSEEQINQHKALSIFEQTGFNERFNSLSMKFETPITKEFEKEGINLSGGEAQKVSIAHVLYSDANILILDEPSSALDPIAEYQLNSSITEISKDKTVIIISHRLSTTRMVDQIFMLEKGQIVEQGNHDQLMKHNGKYAEMFKMQAEKYR